MAEIVRDDQLPAGAGTAREVTPVPSASVLLLRDEPFEVLMILRHAKSSFVPDAWVFPGGVVDEEDRQPGPLNTMRMTAARELYEETGISLSAEAPLFNPQTVDLERLVWTSRWITPVGIPKRFDTYFFLVAVGRDLVAHPAAAEAVDAVWISPADAVQRHLHGDFPLVFPTLKNLEAIVGFRCASDLLEARRDAEIPTTRPVLEIEDGEKKIVLP